MNKATKSVNADVSKTTARWAVIGCFIFAAVLAGWALRAFFSRDAGMSGKAPAVGVWQQAASNAIVDLQTQVKRLSQAHADTRLQTEMCRVVLDRSLRGKGAIAVTLKDGRRVIFGSDAPTTPTAEAKGE